MSPDIEDNIYYLVPKVLMEYGLWSGLGALRLFAPWPDPKHDVTWLHDATEQCDVARVWMTSALRSAFSYVGTSGRGDLTSFLKDKCHPEALGPKLCWTSERGDLGSRPDKLLERWKWSSRPETCLANDVGL
jgi:hypothetical protein